MFLTYVTDCPLIIKNKYQQALRFNTEMNTYRC